MLAYKNIQPLKYASSLVSLDSSISPNYLLRTTSPPPFQLYLRHLGSSPY